MIRAQLGSISNQQIRVDDSANNGPELTPLIDIVFIVVVFLLLTANARILSLPIDIPNSDSQSQQQEIENHSLTIGIQPRAPHWQIKTTTEDSLEDIREFSDWASFKAELLETVQNQNIKILIAPDATANSEHLVQLLALINEQEISDAHILMESNKVK